MSDYHTEVIYRIYDQTGEFYWETSEDSDGLNQIELKYVDLNKEGHIWNEKRISIPLEIVDRLVTILKKTKEDIKLNTIDKK